MVKVHLRFPLLLPAALVVLVAAAFGFAQQSSDTKHNQRPEIKASPDAVAEKRVPADYVYEFKQPEFLVRRIVIEHDADGRGRLIFEKLNEGTPVTEPLDMSPAVLQRISMLWANLRFLDSTEDYQSDRKFPHLGTLSLKMEQGARKRTAEFNWTHNKDAGDLVNEYRKLADQSILVFDISVARESQPLNAPKLMEQMESLLKRNALSDPKQLLPLLKDISIDEHVPLIARNHALRLIKKIEK